MLVPSKLFMNQWASEVSEFGISPVMLGVLARSSRRERLEQLRASLSLGVPRTEVLVMSNALFTGDSDIRSFIDSLPKTIRTMLIGDEVHNLGATAFLAARPERFDYRMGLSATPVRQYDPDGTDALFDFFGPQIFEFSLREAIENLDVW